MSAAILRRRDRTAPPPRVEHYSSAVNKLRKSGGGTVIGQHLGMVFGDERFRELFAPAGSVKLTGLTPKSW